jgi:hypothetical protein
MTQYCVLASERRQRYIYKKKIYIYIGKKTTKATAEQPGVSDEDARGKATAIAG